MRSSLSLGATRAWGPVLASQYIATDQLQQFPLSEPLLLWGWIALPSIQMAPYGVSCAHLLSWYPQSLFEVHMVSLSLNPSLKVSCDYLSVSLSSQVESPLWACVQGVTRKSPPAGRVLSLACGLPTAEEALIWFLLHLKLHLFCMCSECLVVKGLLGKVLCGPSQREWVALEVGCSS